MDSFHKITLDGDENLVGKNIIYKSKITINFYNQDNPEKYKGCNYSFLLLLFLLVGFVGSLLSTEFYLSNVKQTHYHLMVIIILCISLIIVSGFLLFKAKETHKKNNHRAVIYISVLIAMLVLVVFMNSHFWFLGQGINVNIIIPLLILSFMNFVTGVVLFWEVEGH